MAKHILLIDGHPDRRDGRCIHALAGAYRKGAKQGWSHGARLNILAFCGIGPARNSRKLELLGRRGA